jgi:hypothetical protein
MEFDHLLPLRGEPSTRPGHYYVAMYWSGTTETGRTTLHAIMAGPFLSHSGALTALPEVRDLVLLRDTSSRSMPLRFGVCRSDKHQGFGRLNRALGLATALPEPLPA